MVKNPPAMQEPQETQVRFLGWENALEEGMATHSQYSCLENPIYRVVYTVTKSLTRLRQLSTHTTRLQYPVNQTPGQVAL